MTEAAVAPSAPMSVTQVTRYLKFLLEHDEFMSALSVRGEIAEFNKAPSGHVYFTIKDAGSQMNCVLFRREALNQLQEVAALRKGVTVVVHGVLTVYESRSQYQVIANRVVPEGEGAFHRRFEALKLRLEKEGLFAAGRKRTIPPFPKKIALVTSPDGQAYHDVLHRLRSQCPFVTVIVAGVSVQGARAADEMVLALDIVNRLTDAELILLVRGGGSPEDLLAFNEERLARAVFASRVPVITGVGHETDHTIVDFVADLRAATPSLAAAAAVPDLAGIANTVRTRYRDAKYAIGERLRREKRQLGEVNRALLRSSPQHRLRERHQRLDELSDQTHRLIRGHLKEKRNRVNALRSHLGALDPLAILERGYAVLTSVDDGHVVSTRSQAKPGELLKAQVSDGEFRARVEHRG
jgi:exodeoxyribonuclease VII large subunit